jgi:hypothetical protein
MIGVTRSLAQQLCFTRFLIEKDALAASFTRMGSGFTPPTVLSEAKLHLTNINQLMRQMEEMARLPREAVVAKDYRHLMEKSCCGRD